MSVAEAAPRTTSALVTPQRVAELTALIRTPSGESRTTLSPLDGRPVAEIPVSSIADVDAAFAAARTAQEAWSRTSLRERKKVLLRLHDLALEHQDELLDLIQIESGKSRAHAFDEIAHVALTARFYFAGETFGPLVSLYPYMTTEEAVALANQSEYGLNASRWGKPREARAMATRIKAGTVNINEGFLTTFGSVDGPMGGMRQSGLGRRQGAEGILRYTDQHSIGVQRLLPMAGPYAMKPQTWARLLTLGLKILRRTPRA